MEGETQWGQFLTHRVKFPTSRPLPGKPSHPVLLAGFLGGS